MENTELALTQEEINAQFDSEWVLLADQETAQDFTVLRGRVLWHSKDRDEAYRKLVQLKPRSSAILYTGRPNTEMALNI
ncbi:MAG: hypothetical protein EPO24_03070 [Bacteroidetes bacterium]|nr:MAG: hypothetical protein EPO24_03070 [Bacteroidota bacterium]